MPERQIVCFMPLEDPACHWGEPTQGTSTVQPMDIAGQQGSKANVIGEAQIHCIPLAHTALNTSVETKAAPSTSVENSREGRCQYDHMLSL